MSGLIISDGHYLRCHCQVNDYKWESYFVYLYYTNVQEIVSKPFKCVKQVL